MFELIGWIGSLAFAVCAAPQALQCVRQGHTRGLSPWFLGLLMLGELCYIISVLGLFGFVAWMMMNYILNVIWLLIIGKYLIWPRT